MRAVEHPDMIEDLSEIFSTEVLEIEYEIKTDVTVQ